MAKLIFAAILWVLNFIQSPAGQDAVAAIAREFEIFIDQLYPDLDTDGDTPGQTVQTGTPQPDQSQRTTVGSGWTKVS